MRRAVLRAHAHAKINLSLRVLARRDDGYHDLRTVFQSLALHDTLIVTATDRPFALSATDPGVPVDRANLVWRAAEQVWRADGRRGAPRGAHIHLIKRIPAGGGLGGGSSNAAAALRGLSMLWEIDVGGAALEQIARGLGADVPYFLHGGTALGLDRGDAIERLPDLPAFAILLVLPGFAVSTADAFTWFDQAPARPRRAAQHLPDVAGPAAAIVNDLEPVVAARHPAIARVRRQLLGCGALAAAMTGSGSTVFGVFADAAEACDAVQRLDRACTPLVTRVVSRQAFARSSRPKTARSLPQNPPIG